MVELYSLVEEKERNTMSNKQFTRNEIESLSENAYVQKVSSRCIVMTPEFKGLAMSELMRGKSMRQIFTEVGVDPEILGENRIRGYLERIRSQSERDEGFADQRSGNRHREAQSDTAKLEQKIRQLEHRVEYLSQENEFLKKIQELEKACAGKAGKQN